MPSAPRNPPWIRAARLGPRLLVAALLLGAFPPGAAHGQAPAGDVLSFLSAADCHVDAGAPTTNFNSSSVLRVGAAPTRIAYLRFAVAGVNGRSVLQARLRLGVVSGGDSGGTAHLITNGAWSESKLTWATRPAVDGPALATLGPVTAATVVEFVLDGAIRGDGVYDLAIDSTSSQTVTYTSAAAGSGQKPQLVLTLASSAAPTVQILQPPDGSTFFEGDRVTLQGRATDTVDGDLSSAIAWRSSLQGALGTGATLTTPLARGSHTVTATATDHDGFQGTTRVALTVSPRPPANTAPLVVITAPLDGSSFVAGQAIPFAGTANDIEDGVLGPQLAWSSDRDGALGVGASFAKTLSEGTHRITAKVTDRGGLQGKASATVTVIPPGTLTFTPRADAYVDAGAPKANFGSSGLLRAYAGTSRVSYLRFAVSGIGAQQVSHATLRLQVDAASAAASDSGGTVYALPTGSWQESNLTAATAPPPSGPALASVDAVTSGQVVDFDVTAAISGDGTVDLALVTSSLDEVAYGSKESKTPPQLIVMVTGNPPIVTITAPPLGSVLLASTPITLTATATDAEDGDLGSRLRWTSSLDGTIGTGARITPRLRIGQHTITATVTDADGRTGQGQIGVRVRGPNVAPKVIITSPPAASSAPAGTPVALVATATDDFDGDLSARIQWTSSRDGALGAGGARSTMLSEGTHVLTASVTDSDGAVASAQVTRTVTSSPPTVSITAPLAGAPVFLGSPTTFSATALDATDGNLSATVTWTSSVDGPLGTGASIAVGALSLGPHTITAMVQDSGGLVAQAQVGIVVRPPNVPPVIALLAPTEGAAFLVGKPMLLAATASDTENGDLSASVRWTSSRDGVLGTGGALTVSKLRVGAHVLTASVTDRDGAAVTASVNVIVGPATLTFDAVADTYVDAGSPTKAFGRTTGLMASSLPVRQTLVRFAVGGLGGLTVQQALLRFTVGTSGSDGSPAGGSLAAISDHRWAEATTTWATRPAVDGLPLATRAKVSSKQVVDFDVTAGMHGDGTYDFALTSPSTDPVRYQSRETSRPPRLVVMLTQDTPPLVTITTPASGTKIGAATPVTFTGRALDAESGNVSSQIAWSSDHDGALGTGATITVPQLSAGTHTITAAVTQSDGAVGRARITVRVRGPNLPPTVSITAPADGTSVPAGTALTFTATTADEWDDDLSGRVVWTSDHDGALGGGATRTAVLSEGTHTVTATVTDLDGASSQASITVTITPTPPAVTIVAPPSGAVVTAGTLVTFTGTALDFTDGDLSAVLRWSSDRDGTIGTGASVQTSQLSLGTHVITAAAADAGGLVGKARRTVVVNAAPTITLLAPLDGLTVLSGTAVRLAASALDLEQGDLSAAVAWTSDRDGALGTGAALTVSSLSEGTHTLAANVTDAGGATVFASITVTVVPSTLRFTPIADTYVDAGSASTRLGTASDLIVGSNPVRQAYLRFAVSGVVAPFTVARAVLRLTVGPNGSDATKIGPNVFALAGATWSEAATTFATRPSVSGTPLATGGAATPNQVVELDVTPAVSRDGTVDLALTSASSDWVRYLSRESPGGKPELVVTLRQNAPQVTIVQPTPGVTFLTAVPIRLFATAVDPTDGDVAASLTWTSDRDGLIGTGATVTTSSLSAGTHTIIAAAANHAGIAGTAQVSVTVQIASLTFTPIADTYVDQLLATTNFGIAPSLVAVGLPTVKTAFLRFAVSGIAGRALSDVRLQLIVHNTNTASGGEGGTVRLIGDNSWSEATTTFQKMPSLSGKVLDAVPLPVAQGQQVDFRVGAAVTKDGVYNFALTSASIDAVKYDSREGARPPRLVVFFRPPPSALPVVTITSPAATSSSLFDDQPVTLAATATDPKDGVLTKLITWRSSIDGPLGTGGSIPVQRLTRGTHVITASVRDRAGLTGASAVTITVADRPPAIAITAPADSKVFPGGQPVTFTATATDDRDGNLASRVVWTSDRDGQLGTGPSVTTDALSHGDHQITASVTNSLGTSASAGIFLAIDNATPRLTITGPDSGRSVPEGTTVGFTCAATDIEDGDLGGAVTWESSLQGHLGTGGSVPALLSAVGTHRITATVTDSGGATRTREITLTVTLAPPNVTILSPADGSSFSGAVTLAGKAVDYRDGDRSTSIRWRSSLSGVLGRGASIVVPSLPFGRHVITADVTDRDGLTATTTIAIVIGNTPPAVQITSPVNGTSAGAWTPLRFTGTASDVSDGDLGWSLRWFSNLNGPIGTGTSFTTAGLARGTHLITALAADSRGLTGSTQVVVTITTGPPSRPPQVTISAPAPGPVALGAPVTFSGTAIDETGNLSGSLAWVSSLDGLIGTGQSFTTSALSLGSHRIIAAVGDPGGTVGSAAIDLTVAQPEAVFPAVADTFTDALAPATNFGGAPVLELDNQPVRRIYLRFVARGLDPERIRRAVVRLHTTTPATSASDMGGELRTVTTPWDESTATHFDKPALDGPVLATVGAVDAGQTVDFDVTQAITADGTYDFGLKSTSMNGVEYVAREARDGGPQLVVVQDPPAPTHPAVHITAPAEAARLTAAKPVTFTGTASDPQDGDLGPALTWRSSRDGVLGTGPSITKALSPGSHVITATAIDRDGNVASDLVRVVATGAGTPVVMIAAPLDGTSTPFGTAVTFSGTAFDPQDGDLSFSLRWTSNVDGVLGTGASFTRRLSAGTHTITATVTNSLKKSATATARLQVTTTRLGYEDFSFGPNIEVGLDKATATKPQSKLWVQDGVWWACLFVQAKSEVRIHRLDLPTQTWIDTGVPVDDRGKSRQDVLVDGQKLYIASRLGFTGSPPQNRLLRYTYQPGAQTYALDAGFPIDIAGGGAEALTVAKDSLGKVWIAYALNGFVFAAHTLGSDTEWTPPFQPPVPEGTIAEIDDDAAVIRLPGGKIGIFWSNQVRQKFYFAVHTDGAPDLDRTGWRLEIASSLPLVADDHVNLKLASDGRLFVAVKTSINTAGQPTIGLLVRSAAGTWAPLYRVTNFEQGPTRPICILDDVSRRVYVVYSSFMSDIYYKASDMDAIAFPPTGVGTPLLVSGTHPTTTGGINDPTSSKQNPDPGTGILVLASTSETDRYWHGWIIPPAPRPVVTISGPDAGTHVLAGTPLTLSGTAVSATEGVISARLKWTSSRDGQIGTGASVTAATLSPGVHTITAAAADASKLTGSASITVTVDPAP